MHQSQNKIYFKAYAVCNSLENLVEYLRVYWIFDYDNLSLCQVKAKRSLYQRAWAAHPVPNGKNISSVENGETIESDAAEESQDNKEEEDNQSDNGHDKNKNNDNSVADKEKGNDNNDDGDDNDHDDQKDDDDVSTVPSAPPAEELQESWEFWSKTNFLHQAALFYFVVQRIQDYV